LLVSLILLESVVFTVYHIYNIIACLNYDERFAVFALVVIETLVFVFTNLCRDRTYIVAHFVEGLAEGKAHLVELLVVVEIVHRELLFQFAILEQVVSLCGVVYILLDGVAVYRH
jgi:hypothetical protein